MPTFAERATQQRLTAQQIKDRMIRSYLQSYAHAGVKLSADQVEKLVVADCELVDAADRAGELSGGGKPDPNPGRQRPDVLAEAQEQNKVTLGATGTAARRRAMDQNPMLVSERWGAAVARIARILQGHGKSSDLVVAVEGGELGALATEYMDLYAHYLLYQGPAPKVGKDRNPFRGMSPRDASRKFMRLVEDICDRSTGKLGSWYVK